MIDNSTRSYLAPLEKIILDFVSEILDIILKSNLTEKKDLTLLSYSSQNSFNLFLDKYNRYSTEVRKSQSIKLRSYLNNEILINEQLATITKEDKMLILEYHKKPKSILYVNGNSIIKFLYFSLEYIPIFFGNIKLKEQNLAYKIECYKNIITTSIEEFKLSYSHQVIISYFSYGLIQNIFYAKIEELIIKNEN